MYLSGLEVVAHIFFSFKSSLCSLKRTTGNGCQILKKKKIKHFLTTFFGKDEQMSVTLRE